MWKGKENKDSWNSEAIIESKSSFDKKKLFLYSKTPLSGILYTPRGRENSLPINHRTCKIVDAEIEALINITLFGSVCSDGRIKTYAVRKSVGSRCICRNLSCVFNRETDKKKSTLYIIKKNLLEREIKKKKNQGTLHYLLSLNVDNVWG